MLRLPLLVLGLTLITPEEPRSRALSRSLTSSTRLAGTSGSEVAARTVARELEAAGWTVELDRREVLLSYPRRIHLRATSQGIRDTKERALFERHETFDPDQRPPGDVPKFNAWSASGIAEADVVDVGRGLRADYERLKSEGVEVAGKIALANYGGAYRGVKAEFAQAAGCVAVLLCSPSAAEGAGRGPTWPAGPWKPDDAAQRGAIGSLSICPGDPSTPGWASPTIGQGSAAPRLTPEEYDARLPQILCTPLGVGEGEALRGALGRGESVSMRVELDVPRSVRPIVNVIARLPGKADGWVIAGNHRDAWVRGAQDAASGTVTLLRAAQRLGERAQTGWRPERGLLLAFWDAEEYGLIGSTEWAEANADWLARETVAYVNADATVSGTQFRAGGTPGLEAALEAALARVPSPRRSSEGAASNLRDEWLGEREERTLRILGSGSDYTVFLHHLGLPVLDIGFSGNSGGGYHTRFDDFGLMDRFLDPDWVGHELAGHFVAELLEELALRGFDAFDDARAARAMGALALGESGGLLDGSQAERLAQAFEQLAEAVTQAGERPTQVARPRFLQALATTDGLAGRPWYQNRLWAPGLETGYAPETFPELRAASDEAEREARVEELITAIASLQQAWER